MRMSNSTHSSQESEYAAIHEYRFQFLKDQILDLNLKNEAKVLDIGCYPPVLFEFLKQQNLNTYGIASNHEQMADKNIAVLNIETEKFPWKDNTFELALLSEVIEHLPHSPVTPLKEISRVLKPGGYLLITTPNAAKLHHRIKLLAGKSTSFPIDQLTTIAPENGSLYHLHNREYTLSELVQLLSLSDFEVVQAKQLCLYPPTRGKVRQESITSQVVKWLGYLAQQLHPSFKDSLFVIARKINRSE